jgi:putative ABC transport system substrate-binding protein
MKRRALAALSGALLVAPLALLAQPARRPYYRIGFLSGADERSRREFSEGMADLGYVEERHYALAARYYGTNRARIPALAEELIALRPDVIVADASGTAAVLKSKTSTIPIVMVAGMDPVGEGLAQSLARPGGNVTGLSTLGPEDYAKLIEFARLLMPAARRIAFAVNPEHAQARAAQAQAVRAARALGLELVPVNVLARWDLETLPERLASLQADAMVVSVDPMLFALREDLVKAALAAGVPTLSPLAEFAPPGALATYGPDAAAGFRAAARFVERILKGTPAGELPIAYPTQLELVVNVKTAKALRIPIPQPVLLRADRVVE